METVVDFFVWPILLSQMFHMPVLVAGLPGGVIGAVALPTFLNQAAKGKESEAKQNISSVNRAQTAYRAEMSSFSDTFDRLALGVISGSSTSETSNYSYKIEVSNPNITVVTATAKDSALKSYSGAVVRYTNSANQAVMTSVICQTNLPSPIPPAIPQVTGNAPQCPTDSVTIEP